MAIETFTPITPLHTLLNGVVTEAASVAAGANTKAGTAIAAAADASAAVAAFKAVFRDGTIAIPVGAGDVTVAVSFPTAMAAIPRVQATPNSAYLENVRVWGKTKTGFTVQVNRKGGGAYIVDWTASLIGNT